jgi:DNA-directed RNA polymerase subunit RPC12/RpoP
MKAKVTCPRCQFAYQVVPGLGSQAFRCPRCELRIRVRGLPPRRLETTSPHQGNPIKRIATASKQVTATAGLVTALAAAGYILGVVRCLQ